MRQGAKKTFCTHQRQCIPRKDTRSLSADLWKKLGCWEHSSAAPSQASIPSTNSSKSGEPAVVSKLKLETECVLRTLFAIPLQLLWNISRWFYARDWVGSLAGPFPSSSSDLGYYRRSKWYPRFPVSTLLHFKIGHLKRCDSFHATPTFGCDSICRFSSKISELKKLGARDYENLLQVSRMYHKHFKIFT